MIGIQAAYKIHGLKLAVFGQAEEVIEKLRDLKKINQYPKDAALIICILVASFSLTYWGYVSPHLVFTSLDLLGNLIFLFGSVLVAGIAAQFLTARRLRYKKQELNKALMEYLLRGEVPLDSFVLVEIVEPDLYRHLPSAIRQMVHKV